MHGFTKSVKVRGHPCMLTLLVLVPALMRCGCRRQAGRLLTEARWLPHPCLHYCRSAAAFHSDPLPCSGAVQEAFGPSKTIPRRSAAGDAGVAAAAAGAARSSMEGPLPAAGGEEGGDGSLTPPVAGADGASSAASPPGAVHRSHSETNVLLTKASAAAAAATAAAAACAALAGEGAATPGAVTPPDGRLSPLATGVAHSKSAVALVDPSGVASCPLHSCLCLRLCPAAAPAQSVI